MANATRGGIAAASFVGAGFTMLGNLNDVATADSRKRDREFGDEADFDLEDFFFFEDGQGDAKKSKFEDAAMDLMGVHVEDNESTSKFIVECPVIMEVNEDCSAFSFDDDADFVALFFGGGDSSPCCPEAKTRAETKVPATAPPTFDPPGYDSRIPLPSKKWFAALNISIPSRGLPKKHEAKLLGELPVVAVKRVCVEERSLSTDQKAKHARWFQKRQRCLTGHRGYKCPAKSRAAKSKVRSNGRFELKNQRHGAL